MLVERSSSGRSVEFPLTMGDRFVGDRTVQSGNGRQRETKEKHSLLFSEAASLPFWDKRRLPCPISDSDKSSLVQMMPKTRQIPTLHIHVLYSCAERQGFYFTVLLTRIT